MSVAMQIESSADTRPALRTARLWLRPWCEAYRDAFAALHADRAVMADLGGPIDRAGADAKFDRYRDAAADRGVSRWAIDDGSGAPVGYAGVMFRPDASHPLGLHHEIGWRLARRAWGMGYATEAASAALADAARRGSRPVYAYTGPDNQRSQAVMARLALRRVPSLDFTAGYARGAWHGLVWVADDGATHVG